MPAGSPATVANLPGTLRRRERVLAVTQSDATVLMDVVSGRYFTLNEVAGRVWEMLAAPRSTADIITELAGEYDIPPDRLIPDVMKLTERLVQLALLVREP